METPNTQPGIGSTLQAYEDKIAAQIRAANARIDEFTPPGMTADDRSNMTSFEGSPAPVQTVGVQPAATQRVW